MPISSAEAEIWAQSWSLARSVYVLGVWRAVGMQVRFLNWVMGRKQQPDYAVLRAGRKSQPVIDGDCTDWCGTVY